MKRKILAVLLVSGCSYTQQAFVIGQSNKEVVDITYETWDSLAQQRMKECQEKLPPEEHTKSEFDSCVGRLNEKAQSKIVIALKAVQAAQLALFVAISQDFSNPEIRRAVLTLTQTAQEFFTLVKENQP